MDEIFEAFVDLRVPGVGALCNHGDEQHALYLVRVGCVQIYFLVTGVDSIVAL